MKWFKKNDPELERYSEDLAVAYMERARLHYKLLTFIPQLTGAEMSALWVVCATEMRQITKGKSKNDSDETLLETTYVFFDHYCQSYVTDIAESEIELHLTSESLINNAENTLDTMGSDRLVVASELIANLATNALKLSGSVTRMYSKGANEVTKICEGSLAFVDVDKNLNSFEKAIAKEWLVNLKKS